MNKSYWSDLRLNSHLNEKNHQPIIVCEVKIELFTYICTQSL
jgi:hypothetical protein